MGEAAENIIPFEKLKKCQKCGVHKPESLFHRYRMGRQSYCKTCNNAQAMERYYTNNPTRFKSSIDYDAKVKTCCGCGETKEWNAFGFRIHKGKPRIRSRCDVCRARQSREERKTNIEKQLLQDHKSRLKRKYGMTVAEYDAMLSGQGRCCKICHSPKSFRKSNRFIVDHDHITGRVRGLLCTRCNSALGMFGDNPDRLRFAAAYVENGG